MEVDYAVPHGVPLPASPMSVGSPTGFSPQHSPYTPLEAKYGSPVASPHTTPNHTHIERSFQNFSFTSPPTPQTPASTSVVGYRSGAPTPQSVGAFSNAPASPLGLVPSQDVTFATEGRSHLQSPPPTGTPPISTASFRDPMEVMAQPGQPITYHHGGAFDGVGEQAASVGLGIGGVPEVPTFIDPFKAPLTPASSTSKQSISRQSVQPHHARYPSSNASPSERLSSKSSGVKRHRRADTASPYGSPAPSPAGSGHFPRSQTHPPQSQSHKKMAVHSTPPALSTAPPHFASVPSSGVGYSPNGGPFDPQVAVAPVGMSRDSSWESMPSYGSMESGMSHMTGATSVHSLHDGGAGWAKPESQPLHQAGLAPPSDPRFQGQHPGFPESILSPASTQAALPTSGYDDAQPYAAPASFHQFHQHYQPPASLQMTNHSTPPISVNVQPPTPLPPYAVVPQDGPMDFDPDHPPPPSSSVVEDSRSITPASSTVPGSSGSAAERRAAKYAEAIGVDRRGDIWGITLGDFDIIRTLGTGTFGKVLLVRLRESKVGFAAGQHFAMKVLNKVEVVRLKQVEHMNSEKDLLAVVANAAADDEEEQANLFCVRFICTFQDERNLYMLMEFIEGGELFSALRKAGRFSSDVARFFAATILLALQGLHKQDIIYRDLKPENILISRNGYVKITDFGFAKRVPDRTYTLCGTSEYIAPEIIHAKGHGKAADWWAFGVLLFEMLAGYPPFFDDVPIKIYEKIVAARFAFPKHFDPVARDLITRLLTVDLTKRLGNLSGGAEDVKAHPWFEGVPWDALCKQSIPAPIIPRIRTAGDASCFEKYPDANLDELPGFQRAVFNRQFGGHFASPEVGSDPYRHLFETF